MPIEYILFDLDGVYLSNGTTVGARQIAEYFQLDPELVKHVLKSPLGSPGLALRLGEINYAAFLERACLLLGIPTTEKNKQIITHAWFDAYHYKPEMQQLVVELREKGYRIGILTNNFTERFAYVEGKFHFKQYFNHVFISSELRVKKPDIACYQKVLGRIELSPDKVFFVDDKEGNVLAARKIDINAVVFESEQQLRRELSQYNIL